MSDLGELIPAGGGQNNTDFVADGAIASGKPVILTAAGKAAEVDTTPTSDVLGTEAEFDDGYSAQVAVTFDIASGKYVAYVNDAANSSYPTAVVGTVTGTSISWGTPVVIASAGAATTRESNVVAYDAKNEKTIAFIVLSATSYPTTYIGTISGTTSSWTAGQTVTTESQSGGSTVFYDPSSENMVFAWGTSAGGENGTARVASSTGTSFTFGTATVFRATTPGGTSDCVAGIADTTNNKIILVFPQTNGYPASIIGTVTGTAVAFDTIVAAASEKGERVNVTYDASAPAALQVWQNGTDAKIIAFSISGTTQTYGTAITLSAGSDVGEYGIGYNSTAERSVVAYQDNSDTSGRYRIATISGTTVTLGAETAFFPANAVNDCLLAASGPDPEAMIVYRDAYAGDDSYGIMLSIGYDASNMTSSNLLGIASAAILDTATGTINTWGSRNEVQTSLTIASDYYVQTDGTITTASASPAQLIGEAITATQINIKDYTG